MTLYNHFYLLFTKNKTLIFVKAMVISLDLYLQCGLIKSLDILLLISVCYIYTLKQSEASKIEFTIIMVARI